MSNRSPPVDRRSFDELVAQLETLLKSETTWRRPKERADMDRGGALVRLVAHLAESVLSVVNRAPDKNRVAFLDMIGARMLPPTAARVPLTFTLSEGAAEEPIVRAGTQVAAISAEAAPPVIFETEEDLATTRTLLCHVYSLLPEKELFTDDSEIATRAVAETFRVFDRSDASRKIDSYLAIGAARLVGGPPVDKYVVTFTAGEGKWGLLLAKTEWIYKTGATENDMEETAGSNFVSLKKLAASTDQPLPPLPPIAGVEAGWLIAVLPARTADNRACTFANVTYALHVNAAPVLPAQAIANETPVDLTLPFYPFGQEPQVGDCFYLDLGQMLPVSNLDDAVDKGVQQVYGTLKISLYVTLQIGAAGAGGVTLLWQYWDAKVQCWKYLGQSSAQAPTAGQDPHKFVDRTLAFTRVPTVDPLQPFDIAFDCPDMPGVTEVMGLPGHWIRIAITAGSYGSPASYKKVGNSYEYEPSTLKPPMIKEIRVSAKNTSPKAVQPDMVLTADTLRSVNVTKELQPPKPSRVQRDPIPLYVPLPSDRPTLFLGFERSGDDIGFANRQVSIYFDVPPTISSARSDPSTETVTTAGSGGAKEEDAPADEGPPRDEGNSNVRWQYCRGDPPDTSWHLLGGQDETIGFTRAGVLSFIGPPDFERAHLFGKHAFWLRAVLEDGESNAEVGRIAPNTVAALNVQVVTDETLGSSSAEPSQTFKTSRVPVLDSQKIDVRESDVGRHALAEIEAEEGPGAVVPAGETGELWVRWHEVPDFYTSGPGSRHYVFDHESGTLTFGDGQSGMIPPAGRDNVRAAQYRFGGGPNGNLAAGTITQLRTTIPGVASVTNIVAADGGARGETLDQALVRAPTKLRHRDRAVAAKDYVDLAHQTTRTLARVACLAASDEQNAGSVTLVVVPQSSARRPAPTNELLAQITKQMLPYVPAAVAKFSVVGPHWREVNIKTEVVPVSPIAAADVESAILAALDDFLNPISGGPDRKGWPFDEVPFVSQVTAVVARVPGVDHVRTLVVEALGAGIEHPFMIFSGNHTVMMWSGVGGQAGASRRRNARLLGSGAST